MNRRKLKHSCNLGIIINLVLLVSCALIATLSIAEVYAYIASVTGAYDEKLSPKINAFLESVQPVTEQSSINGHPDYGNAKMYCYSFVYGHDTENVYAHATCRTIAWRYHYQSLGPSIKITRELDTVHGQGWSSYIKLTYKPGTDFDFTGYKFPPGVGTDYYSSATEMFKMKRLKLPPTTEAEKAYKGLESRFHADNDNAPMPDHIDEIYGMKSPKIVY